MVNVPYYVLGSQNKTIYTLPCSLPIKWSDSEVDIVSSRIPKERIHFHRNSLVISQFTYLFIHQATCFLNYMISVGDHLFLFLADMSGTQCGLQ